MKAEISLAKYILDDNIERTYAPDLYLPEFNKFIEIKGYFSKRDKMKLDTVKKQNEINLTVLFKKDLKEFNII